MARIILPVWNDLLKVKDLYLKGRIMIVGDGEFTDSGLSSKIIFRGAILCMKEEKKMPRNYIQIGSMHVEIG